MSPELQDWVWRAAIGLVIALILYGVKDWRKTRNENELAEETRQPKVARAGIETLEAQILAMSKAWEEERASKDRQIDELKEQHADCRQRIDRAEEAVTQAQEKMREAQEKMAEMAKELEKFRRQLEQFTNIAANPNEEEL